jgi:hypothetical protein
MQQVSTCNNIWHVICNGGLRDGESILHLEIHAAILQAGTGKTIPSAARRETADPVAIQLKFLFPKLAEGVVRLFSLKH